MDKKLNLIHLANFNSTNIGNGALISGLEEVMSADLSRPVEWTREAWDDYTFGFRLFDENFVDFVNRHDGIVVNGAVAIHGRQYLETTGMRFELPLSLLDKIKRPVVFYGLSYRHFKGQEFHHAEILKRTLKEYSDRSNVFMGVRNDGTKRWLQESLNLSANVLERIHEVPDTGVFVKASAGIYPEILPHRKMLILAPNDEDAPYRYGEPNCSEVHQTGYDLLNMKVEPREEIWQNNRNKLILAIKGALSRLLDTEPMQLLLVPHYLDDLKFIARLVDSFKPQIAHQMTLSTGLMRVPGTRYFYGRYLKADLAVSMRVHSMSPCIGLGVPMIPLVTQPRMWDFLDSVDLSDLAVDAFSDDLEDKLFELCRNTLNEPKERKQRFETAKKAMRSTLHDINTQIDRMFQ